MRPLLARRHLRGISTTVRVFDDGQHVYIQMPATLQVSEAPALAATVVAESGLGSLLGVGIFTREKAVARATSVFLEETGLTFEAFSHAELRTMPVERFGAEVADVTAARLGYQLTELRAKGLLRKVAGRNRYTLTDRGYRVTLYCTTVHERLFSPALDSLERVVRPALVASAHRLDRALVDLNAHFDHLAELSGVKVAA